MRPSKLPLRSDSAFPRPACGPQATLHHTIQLHPQFLGKGIVDTVIQELEKEVEGENIAGVGCIVAVITVPVRPGGPPFPGRRSPRGFATWRRWFTPSRECRTHAPRRGVPYLLCVFPQPGGVSMGRVDALTGFVKFRVTYIAVVFRPLQMEVLDAKVQSVSEFGFFAQLGPIEVFVADAVSARGHHPLPPLAPLAEAPPVACPRDAAAAPCQPPRSLRLPKASLSFTRRRALDVVAVSARSTSPTTWTSFPTR